MKHEQLANEIYWAMEHGELNKVDKLIESAISEQIIRKETRNPMYSPGCYELAVSLLSDYPDKDNPTNREYLAQHIQTEIEDVIEYTFKSHNEKQP